MAQVQSLALSVPEHLPLHLSLDLSSSPLTIAFFSLQSPRQINASSLRPGSVLPQATSNHVPPFRCHIKQATASFIPFLPSRPPPPLPSSDPSSIPRKPVGVSAK